MICATACAIPFGAPSASPAWAAQPWPYTFKEREEAWAMGMDGIWRLVTVSDEGTIEKRSDRVVMVYSVEWQKNGMTFRGTFCPTDGDIKPNTESIRLLLEDEGVQMQSTPKQD